MCKILQNTHFVILQYTLIIIFQYTHTLMLQYIFQYTHLTIFQYTQSLPGLLPAEDLPQLQVRIQFTLQRSSTISILHSQDLQQRNTLRQGPSSGLYTSEFKPNLTSLSILRATSGPTTQ